VTTRPQTDGKGLLCLQFTAGETMSVSHDRPGFAGRLAPHRFRFETHQTGGAGWLAIALRIFWTVLVRRPDVAISSEYRRSFLVSLALLMTLNRAPHVVLGMNLSAKPIVSARPVVQRAINRIFRRASAIVVHSTKEAELFAQLHDLPAGCFAFSHWGFDLPPTDRFDAVAQPYFCMIGRNNRDLVTFAKAVALAGTRGIAVVPGYQHVDPALERGLEIHRDLSMADCISCLRSAVASVNLLRDGSRGAGHITVVTAMHLGIPQIYSEAEVLRDYFPDDRFGLAVPIGDAATAASAMRQVLAAAGAPDEAARITARKEFASRWLSNDSAARRIADVLTAAVEGRPQSFLDPGWVARPAAPNQSAL
jgi:glycosyltransferase involved in cell wall biosynthesis